MPILVPIAEGVVEGGEAIEAGIEGYEAYRAAKAAETAAKLARAAAALEAARQGVHTDACSTCPPPEDPCAHLSRGGGNGPYRGGSHDQMTKPRNDGLDSHHMPPNASIRDTMDVGGGAAIQMLQSDHRATSSYGNRPAAQQYRAQQADLIRQGKYGEAFTNDAADVRRVASEAGEPSRYDQAIKEAQAYADCVAEHHAPRG